MTIMKKNNLHPRSIHQGRYDLAELVGDLPELAVHVFKNKHNIVTVDFSDPQAVFYLNKALLVHHYQLKFWEIPKGYLCPPVPGRADYLHYIADLLAPENGDKVPLGAKVKGLDVGTGASAIYPMLGHRLFQWSFLATETDETALNAARKNIAENQEVLKNVEIVQQMNPSKMFEGIINYGDKIDFTMSNPPFHSSPDEAVQATQRKIRNLGNRKAGSATRNFGGRAHELWTDGGELKFIQSMILESRSYADNCKWFTTLVSKKANLPIFEKVLAQVSVKKQRVIEMGQGQKQSRILCWGW